ALGEEGGDLLRDRVGHRPATAQGTPANEEGLRIPRRLEERGEALPLCGRPVGERPAKLVRIAEAAAAEGQPVLLVETRGLAGSADRAVGRETMVGELLEARRVLAHVIEGAATVGERAAELGVAVG